MKKTLYILASVAIFSLPFSSVALAENPKPQEGLKICEKRQHKAEKRMDRREYHQGKREDLLAKRLDKLNKQIEKASSEGKDVSKIKADLETLKQKTAKLSITRQALDEILSQAKDMNCDSSTKAKIKDIRDKAKPIFDQIKSDQKDVRGYMRNIIKSDLEAIGITNPQGAGAHSN
jgi:DNA repair exonuclease SbcCD ATPase subunit